jgi:prepilin-type N-terminal cleavage/methylation domain-containing protein
MVKIINAITKSNAYGNIFITHNKHTDQRGLTLMELMFVLAIIAVLAAVAIPNIVQQIRQAQTAKAVRTVYSAWATLASTAVDAGGATLKQQGNSLILIFGTTSVGPQIYWSLPENTTIELNGTNFTCLSLDENGIPSSSVTSACSTNIGSRVIPAFAVSVDGGANVPASP